MSMEVLFVILAVCQLICVLIPIIEKKSEITSSKSNFTKSDIFLIALSIIGFGVSISIFMLTKDEESANQELENKYKNDLKIKLAERDSIHEIKDSLLTVFYTSKVESSYTKSITASNDALAKYNLVLIDSMNKVAAKINYKAVNQPQIALEASTSSSSPIYLSTINNNDYLNIRFASFNNTAYNITIKYCIIDEKKIDEKTNYYKVLDCGTIYENRKFLLTGRYSTSQIKVNPIWSKLNNILIVFSGYFSSDQENRNKIEYYQIFEFNFKTQKAGAEVMGKNMDSLKMFLLNGNYFK